MPDRVAYRSPLKQDHSRKLVPPKAFAPADAAAGEKDCCRRADFPEQRRSAKEIVSVTIIKGNCDGFGRQIARRQGCYEVIHREDLPRTRQRPQLLAKAFGRYRKTPRVYRRIRHSVIH